MSSSIVPMHPSSKTPMKIPHYDTSSTASPCRVEDGERTRRCHLIVLRSSSLAAPLFVGVKGRPDLVNSCTRDLLERFWAGNWPPLCIGCGSPYVRCRYAMGHLDCHDDAGWRERY